MHVRCLDCNFPIELVNDVLFSDVLCPSCGSSVGLAGDSRTADDLPPSSNQVGHFQLTQLLGMGAFGAVWKATDTELDRTVAVKIPRKGQLRPDEAERFLREARASAQLKHPNIVSVHEVGLEDGLVYIVSELVDGCTLADRLSAGHFGSREAAELCAKIADALHHAHESGVIHRDLKPSNIMLDEKGEPHVMDFGLAKREAGEITMTIEGQVLGTPAYMSPEQATGGGHDADRRSDVYSLGVILFELLTGALPFNGNKRMLLHQVIHDEPPSPRKLNAVVPRDLEVICLKCLEKRGDDRYGSACDLADDLRRYLDGQSIAARPRSYGRIFVDWARRPQRVPQAAALILIIAAFFGLSTAAGLCMLAFAWAPIHDPSMASVIVGLDFTGFALCLPIGLSILAKRPWSIWLGLLVGGGMTAIVFILIATGFDGGGLLSDPFQRVSIYVIFGFVGVVMSGLCVVALMSHRSSERADVPNLYSGAGSTEREQLLLTTIDLFPRNNQRPGDDEHRRQT